MDCEAACTLDHGLIRRRLQFDTHYIILKFVHSINIKKESF